MINDWFTDLSFDTDWESFRQLPRHPAYRYEFKDGRCLISGRPLFYHVARNLESIVESDCDHKEDSRKILPVEQADWSELVHLFAGSFSRLAPFIHLSEERKLAAAKSLLQRTLNGDDGPLVDAASFILKEPNSQEICGAILVTLVPSDDFIHFEPEKWSQQPPVNAVKNGWGQPHLTWVFVSQNAARQGIGEALLRRSAQQLLKLGYSTLVSTFLSGNQASTLWHWKMGFRLLSHVSSQ